MLGNANQETIASTGQENVDYKKLQEESDVVIDKLLKEVESLVELTKKELEKKEPAKLQLETSDNLIDNGDGTYSRKASSYDSQGDDKMSSKSDYDNSKSSNPLNHPTKNQGSSSSSSSSNNKNNLPENSNQKYHKSDKKTIDSDKLTTLLDNSQDISSQISKIESQLDEDIQEEDDTVPLDDTEDAEDEGNVVPLS